ncbi:NADAR family protein [Actinocorallia populi]|uniref:NADAR family protein n=1 Tax=Actinocorallia populi TaxID=2079200 RepID=UPI000D092A03|nr:NADAR family protein [Actinocorallia populi]
MEPRSVEDLRKAQAADAALKYLFFWGHRPHPSGRHVLSQWFEHDFEADGQVYRSAEHYMMAGKARLFGDAETEALVLASGHPDEAKRLGRRVRGFDDRTWAEHRFELVVQGNVAKFGADPGLRGYLLGTGTRVLVEASPLDRIWGIGLAADDERAADPARWRGLNLLGFALMEARARLR